MSRKSRLSLLIMLCLGLSLTAAAQVMMNEFLYDTQGTDDLTIMYVEIYGPPSTNLSGWSLVGINGNGGTEYLTVPLTGTIPTDGYYVVGGSAVQNVDQVVSADFQNAGSSAGEDCDGIDLRNASNQTVDHLCYGPCAAGHVCTGEGGSNAPDPFPSGGINYAVARIPDHQDTDNNGTDWAQTDQLTPGLPNSGEPCDPQYVTLSDIRENDANGVSLLDGDFVVVRGVVNVNNYTLDSLTLSNFYIQDDDAGCNVFRGTVPAGILEGDCVVVSGWVDSYNGLTELVGSGSGNCTFSVDVVANVDTVIPTVITGASFFEAFEGMLVRMDNISIIDGTWPAAGQFANLTVTDGNGTIVVRIDDDTQVDGTPPPPATFGIIGILTQFDNSSPYNENYQITLRYPADVLRGSAADELPSVSTVREFALRSAYPNPFNSTAQIRFDVGSARELALTIYDITGRVVLSERLTGLTPGAHSYAWTPNTATGLYLLRLSGANRVETSKLLYLK